MAALIMKASGRDIVHKDTEFVAYFRGQEVKALKVYFNGDDYSVYSRFYKSYLTDEHGCQFFGLDKAEEIVDQYCSGR